jgi:chemotaxis protein CheD
MTRSTPGRKAMFRTLRSGLPHVFLLPGGMHCAADPTLVTTVLGSCVAVCLLDRRCGLGGINHFLLPRGGSGDEASLRYGDIAIDRLVDALIDLGAKQAALVAKIFGGAAVLHTNAPDLNVGVQNIDMAVERLQAHGIPIVARRTGGTNGVAIRLFTKSGRVLVRQIASSMG